MIVRVIVVWIGETFAVVGLWIALRYTVDAVRGWWQRKMAEIDAAQDAEARRLLASLSDDEDRPS